MPADKSQSSAPEASSSAWGRGRGLATRPAEPRAIVPGQTISLSDTAIQAMPSQSKDLDVLHHRDGPFAQQLRILATRIEERAQQQGSRSFLITSVGDGDGKTVVASNLALVMSEDSERRVALVDANFRSPRAAALFNLDSERGLLAAMEGRYPLAQCVGRVMGRNLVVLHAGGAHAHPATILSSPSFKSLLAELQQQVDVLLVDAPSALPHADVPLISQCVDSVLMVTTPKTRRGLLDKAMQVIGPSRIAGGVFIER